MENEIVEKKKNPVLFKIGIVLLIMYPIIWLIALAISFTPLSTGVKAIVIPAGIIIGEIFFLIGVAFVGKELVTKYKDKLNPKNWGKRGK